MADTIQNEHRYDATKVDGIISKISLPSTVTGGEKDLIYEIHDAKAIHSAEDLGLSAALRFLGVKTKKGDLPTTGNKNGDVWHVTEDEYEYVWDGDSWEELGAPHDFVGTGEFKGHTHEFNKPSASIASLTVTGTTDAYKANTTSLSAKASDITVSKGSTTKDVLASTARTTISAVTNVTPTVDSTTQRTGTEASFSATVDNNGVLAFTWTANTPSTVATSIVTNVASTIDEAIEVSFADNTTNVTAVADSWTATTPNITLNDSASINVATGISKNGTNAVTASASNIAVTVSGGSVGAVK